MARRISLFFIIAVLFILKCNSQMISSDDRLRQIISQTGQAEVTIPFTGFNSFDFLTRNVSVLSLRDKVVHISLSRLTVGWFIMQKYNYQILERMAARGITSAVSVNQAMDWDTYPSYIQYDSIMHSFSQLYPSLCRLDTIGTSVNGKLVLALRISGSAVGGEHEPAVFYTSTMHGDETGGFVLMLHLADYLLKNYNTSNRVKNLVDNLEIYINPLANPDGTYGTGNVISSPTRYNANGYDLNRNFPDPFTPNTVRQKETIDMIKYLRKHRFVLSANFHSGSEVVNYPWDRWLSRIHADDAWFNVISRDYADTAHIYGGPEYMNYLDNGVSRGALWYIVYGGRQDFVTWELQGREVTIELDDQYITPAPQLPLLWQNNWHSLLGYLENALYGIHGLVRNFKTHLPVPATVYIEGYDKDSSQVYSDTLTGRFVRFLSPGSWNLTFTATGYQPLLMTDISVSDRQRTDLIADMTPTINGIEDTHASNAVLLFPNPAGTTISLLLPDSKGGNLDIRIVNSAGITESGYHLEGVPGTPLSIDIGSLFPGIYSIVVINTQTGETFFGRFVVAK